MKGLPNLNIWSCISQCFSPWFITGDACNTKNKLFWLRWIGAALDLFFHCVVLHIAVWFKTASNVIIHQQSNTYCLCYSNCVCWKTCVELWSPQWKQMLRAVLFSKYMFFPVSPLFFVQLTPLPSCTAVSVGSCWREQFTHSSSHRETQRQANTRTTLGKTGVFTVLEGRLIALVLYYQEVLMCFSMVWMNGCLLYICTHFLSFCIFFNISHCLSLSISFSVREFSSALDFLQLLNSCTEDSPSPPPPFSAPPNHTTTPGMDGMNWHSLFDH